MAVITLSLQMQSLLLYYTVNTSKSKVDFFTIIIFRLHTFIHLQALWITLLLSGFSRGNTTPVLPRCGPSA